MRNKEVDALNQNVRKLLKEQKILTGLEYRRTSFDKQLGKKISEYFMAGDRIVFKTSNQELQTKNVVIKSPVQTQITCHYGRKSLGGSVIINFYGIYFLVAILYRYVKFILTTTFKLVLMEL